MASKSFRAVLGACIAGSMVFSSTAAFASAPAATQQVNPWAVLTAMSGGAPAAAICGAAAGAATAAAQPVGGCVLPVMDATPPPPVAQAVPVVPATLVPEGGTGISPLLLGLFAVAAGAGAYLALHSNNHPNSPA